MTKVAILLEQIRADRLGAAEIRDNREKLSVGQTKGPGAANAPTRFEVMEETPAQVTVTGYRTLDNLPERSYEAAIGKT